MADCRTGMNPPPPPPELPPDVQWRCAQAALAQLNAACHLFVSVHALHAHLGKQLSEAFGDTPSHEVAWVPIGDGFLQLQEEMNLAWQGMYLAFSKCDDLVKEVPQLKTSRWFQQIRRLAVGIVDEANNMAEAANQAIADGGGIPPRKGVG